MEENKFGSDNQDSYIKLLESNKSLVLFAIFMVMVNVVMLIAYLNIETKVKVELPPKFISNNVDQIEIELTNDGATSDYYKVWGYYYITLSANFDRKNIRKKMQLLVKAYEPEILKKVRKDITSDGKEFETSDFMQLKEFQKNITKDKITQIFTVVKVNDPEMVYGNDEATVKIEGMATQYFEKHKDNPIIKDKLCSYTISFNRKGGVTYVSGYQTDCFK